MQNPFKDIMRLFQGGGGSALGIDFGSSAVKVVQLRKTHGHAVLETYGELAVGPYGNAEIGQSVRLSVARMSEALTDVLRESKVSGRDCGVAIPISSSLVTTIEMPLVDDKQFAQMVPIEARKYIPVPISEVALDWWVIPKENGEVTYPLAGEATAGAPAGTPASEAGKDLKSGRLVDVLLAVIHNDAISNYQSLVKSAGLTSTFYEVEIFSTLRASLSQETKPVMILDMGAATTKLYIVDRGIVKSSHMVNRGSQDITMSISRALNISVKEAELLKRNVGLDMASGRKDIYDIASTTLSYILSEANRVVFNYEKRTGQSLSRIILTGGGVLLKEFYGFAQRFFETEAVMADPFAKVESPAFLDNILKRAGPEFAVAIGLALRKLQELP
ncbi:MAG: hypothetical protein A2664_02020 [Candidatus Taylorbacteria bacterium RIFCSPHIGHO2_01_FULL_46_22b]|uniref:SHS2 domain-containing protein n=1 Tax=Candidatus Taylorbacteria bacterium RIFCSPHIGHO2_01_FULL_46_22b TaxID=1802301 RepID=A0A1G2M388_9BACT|nr:MAG: hypothetical protein A2664_02020 [Candidatus Taylorbacteria bacterium RIFCSPHIGHO2_01_FULL_46_22b]